MKLKNSNSISDSEQLNFFEDSQEEVKEFQQNKYFNILPEQTPFTEVVTIFSTSPPSATKDPASHDKIYYDDRFNESVFDPFLAFGCITRVLISITGMLLTGFFLNIIITWNVFTNVPELFVLIPVILNLRGILEQGLTSRLAKASRIGVMESISGRKKIWLGNLNLVMFQSITAGLLAGSMSCFLTWLLNDGSLKFWPSILMIVVSAATTASSSVLSGFFLFLMLQMFKRFKVNPDDFIGALTNSFGGFMSLFILAIYAGFFYLWMGSWFGVIAMACLLISSNVYFYYKAQKNEAVGTLTSEGWPSILFSLIVTGFSGLLLQKFISEYQSVFALFLPVFTGITGTFSGIYCSEAIVHLHLFQLNNLLPRKTALTLLILSNPVQIILVFLIKFLNSDQISLSFSFFIFYLFAQNVQVLLLIALADILIKISWKLSMKPETNVPTLMSTLSDFSGTLVLVSVFYILKNMGNLNLITSKTSETLTNNLSQIATESIGRLPTDSAQL